MQRTTRVVSGPLALRMERIRAAQDNALGVEITTLPLLAARLAGGFRRPAATEALQLAIHDALKAGAFIELEGVRDLPGMVRAVQRTLTAAWRADVNLDGSGGARLADLATLDRHIRGSLPPGVLVPPDLRDAALVRLVHADNLLGAVHLIGIVDIDPVWRPLIAALAKRLPVSWTTQCAADRSWFPGTKAEPPTSNNISPTAVVCADPRSEVVEALRWARNLLASGVPASSIGITATSCEPWDEAMLVLSRSAELPVHFTHGIAALEEPAGQACAALADVLLRGLSQARVRRLLRRSTLARKELPGDWANGLRRSAGLFTEAQWRTALVGARRERSSGVVAEEVLMPHIAELARGVAYAPAAGERLLDGPALALWRQALRAAPAEALDVSVQALRVADGLSPGAAVVWAPAAHLAAAPRPHVRLLGLTGRGWPRAGSEDPLLPDHVLPREQLEPVPRSEQDIRLFHVIRASASGSFVLSRSRRSSEGALLAPSRLFPVDGVEVLAKGRTPAHAFSEADRLLARPLEAQQKPKLALARSAWRAWQSPDATAWDGQISPDDPVVRAELSREQSATSLRRLLRDPLGFIWRYGLGWRPADAHADVLALDLAGFGELVHELIRLAAEALEPTPGLNRATPQELENAVSAAGEAVARCWAAERPVPPALLWQHTVDDAVRLAVAGLAFDQGLQPGTRSWSEAAFGQGAPAVPPWDSDAEVRLGGLRVGGRIDRVDLRGDSGAARVTDYKTGAVPRNMAAMMLAGGAELQRVIYAAAVRQRLPDVRQVVSRLVYLHGSPEAHALSGDPLESAIAEAERFIATAVALISGGAVPPGPDAKERFGDLRLALPADLDVYLHRKSRALSAAAGELPSFWRAP
jgi:PD-(D/E)XK nuclease superfamily